MIQILNNQYPIGWEWVAKIPIAQIVFFYDLMATVTDNTDIYRSLHCECEASYSQNITKINYINRVELAKFLNNDQGYEGGIKYHLKWILATNVLHCTNLDEYMAKIDEIERLSRLNLMASEG